MKPQEPIPQAFLLPLSVKPAFNALVCDSDFSAPDFRKLRVLAEAFKLKYCVPDARGDTGRILQPHPDYQDITLLLDANDFDGVRIFPDACKWYKSALSEICEVGGRSHYQADILMRLITQVNTGLLYRSRLQLGRRDRHLVAFDTTWSDYLRVGDRLYPVLSSVKHNTKRGDGTYYHPLADSVLSFIAHAGMQGVGVGQITRNGKAIKSIPTRLMQTNQLFSIRGCGLLSLSKIDDRVYLFDLSDRGHFEKYDEFRGRSFVSKRRSPSARKLATLYWVAKNEAVRRGVQMPADPRWVQHLDAPSAVRAGD